MIRDAEALEAAYRLPFDGYARHLRCTPFLARIGACVAILTVMLLSGVILGTPSDRQLQRR